jgi:hypothetical protein
MAEPKGGLAFIPETTSEAVQANKAYQEALNRLNSALEARQNKMFDPTMLALAEGFLTPGRTGSFGESLGVAAGKMRAAEEEEGKTEMALAQAKLGLAERGIALEQQRQRERQFREAIEGAPGGVSAGATAGVPSGGQAGAEAPQRPEDRLAQAVSDTPPAVQGMVGIQVFPPTQNLVTSRSLLMQRYREGKMSLGDALAEAAKLENDRYVFRDNSVLDKLTGRMFFSPTGNTQRIMTSKGPMELPTDLIRLGRPELIEQYIKNLPSTAEVAGREAGARAGAERGESANQIKVNLPRADGTYGSYDIPAQAAFELGRLITQHGINSPEVLRYASKFTGESAGPAPSAAPAALPGAAPAATAPAAPSVGGAAGRVPSESERATSEAASAAAAKTRATNAAERESKLGEINFSAAEMQGVANRISRVVDESGKFIGVFARPGLGPAILGLIQDSIRTGRGGVVEVPTLENAVRKVMPGVKKSDIANIEKAQADLANLELLYRKTFLAGQGAVSNMEGQVVARLGGTTGSTPETLVHRMNLIRARAQFDRADVSQFNQWKERNPSKNYYDWQTTPQYNELLKSYEQRLSDIDQAASKQTESPAPRRPTWDPKKQSWEF